MAGKMNAFVVGSLIGAGVALLCAPRSGSETKALMAHKAHTALAGMHQLPQDCALQCPVNHHSVSGDEHPQACRCESEDAASAFQECSEIPNGTLHDADNEVGEQSVSSDTSTCSTCEQADEAADAPAEPVQQTREPVETANSQVQHAVYSGYVNVARWGRHVARVAAPHVAHVAQTVSAQAVNVAGLAGAQLREAGKQIQQNMAGQEAPKQENQQETAPISSDDLREKIEAARIRIAEQVVRNAEAAHAAMNDRVPVAARKVSEVSDACAAQAEQLAQKIAGDFCVNQHTPEKESVANGESSEVVGSQEAGSTPTAETANEHAN